MIGIPNISLIEMCYQVDLRLLLHGVNVNVKGIMHIREWLQGKVIQKYIGVTIRETPN